MVRNNPQPKRYFVYFSLSQVVPCLLPECKLGTCLIIWFLPMCDPSNFLPWFHTLTGRMRTLTVASQMAETLAVVSSSLLRIASGPRSTLLEGAGAPISLPYINIYIYWVKTWSPCYYYVGWSLDRYALERTSDHIKIFFWSRKDPSVPLEVREGLSTISPSNWVSYQY